MTEKRCLCDPDLGEESVQHLHESGDAIVDQWLVRATETRQVHGDDAMRGRKSFEAERPLVGVPAHPMYEHKRRPLPCIVVEHLAAKDRDASQIGKRG